MRLDFFVNLKRETSTLCINYSIRNVIFDVIIIREPFVRYRSYGANDVSACIISFS